VVKDLFFVARIRETARLAGVLAVFARTPDELRRALAEPARLILIDLTAGLDYDSLFAAAQMASPRASVLGFTTHALASATRPLHERCDRVVTKETLSQELPTLLKEGIVA
jgi:hypothetical protein